MPEREWHRWDWRGRQSSGHLRPWSPHKDANYPEANGSLLKSSSKRWPMRCVLWQLSWVEGASPETGERLGWKLSQQARGVAQTRVAGAEQERGSYTVSPVLCQPCPTQEQAEDRLSLLRRTVRADTNFPEPHTASTAQRSLSVPPQSSHGKITKLDMIRVDNGVASISQIRRRSPWAEKGRN